MKDNYNIKVNPPELSSEQIKQHQNFDALLASFEQAPTASEEDNTTKVVALVPSKSRRWKYIASGIVTLIAASLIFSIFQQPLEEIPTAQPPTLQINEVLALNSPMPTLAKPVERKTVQAEKGETLTYASGSKVTIPAAAFVDKQGLPVKGEVEITYREFNDPVDMFLAGIPKQLNKHQDLQSTGMMEIKGFQNGEPVYLTMDKSLSIELKGKMMTDMPTKDLGAYVYSQQEDAWAYNSKDDVEILEDNTPTQPTPNTSPTLDPTDPTLAPLIAQLEEEQRASKPVAPIRPGLPSGMQVFNFDIDLTTAPELAQYNQDIDLMSASSNLTPSTFDTIWSDMRLTGNKKDGYVMVLEYEDEVGTTTRQFDVEPVVIATNEAKAQYEVEQARYEAELEAWEQHIMVLAQAQITPIKELVNIVNRFDIKRFGLWNCGKPVEWKQSDAINTQFVDLEGAPIALQEVFVAAEQQQFYYSSPTTNNGSKVPLRYDKPSEQKIWAMSAEGELLVAEIAQDKPAESANAVLSMRPVALPESAADLRELLTF